MELHFANQSLKSTGTAQCFSENPTSQNEKLIIKENKGGTYVSGWFLFFPFSPLSFPLICITWSCCCTQFTNNHIRQHNFLQKPAVTKSSFLHTNNGMDGIMEELPLSCTVFFFLNGLTKLKCRHFNLFFLLCFPTSVSTHLYELEASSLLIQDQYHEITPILRVCKVTHHAKYWCAPLQVWLCRPLLCLKNMHIKPKNLCQCSPLGKILSFSIFLPQMVASGCSVYLEYCFWLTIHGRNCL